MAWDALGLLQEPIEHDDVRGEITGTDEVEHGLDAMADALSQYHRLGLDGESLDVVLSEICDDDNLVEISAELAECVERATYAGGITRAQVKRAERLRVELVEELDELLTGYGN
jgi:hypothetical protein